MVELSMQDADVSLDEPVLVEGLPGVGLVGKIAADHLVESFDMTYYAGIESDGLPEVAVYEGDSRQVRPPVRLYADAERDLLVLQSDIPVSRTAAADFAAGLTDWVAENDCLPIYLSGMPNEDYDATDVPDLYGVAAGSAGGLLDEQDIGRPPEAGVVGGPAGALLNRAADRSLDAVGLIAESDPQFPDPVSARRIITGGIEPLTGIEVATDELVEEAEQIREQKEKLAQRMRQVGEEESSQATPQGRGMFQ